MKKGVTIRYEQLFFRWEGGGGVNWEILLKLKMFLPEDNFMSCMVFSKVKKVIFLSS